MQNIHSFVKNIYYLKHKHISLYILGLMMLFWSLFDGIMAYVAPLIITDHNFSKTYMGFIIGSSSIFGALFDILSFKILPTTYFRRVFMIMFILCAIYPFILMNASTIVVYLLAMGIWGIYYDLKNFGNLDFIGRFTPKNEHSSSFGIIQVFQSVGYLIAPIITGILIAETLNWKPFAFALGFLLISFTFFFELIGRKSFKETPNTFDEKYHLRKNQLSELKLWLSLDKAMLPVLILTLMLYIIDASFWTIGPLFAESFSQNKAFAGFIMTAYSLPCLLVGWFVGKFTSKYGKEKTAFFSLLTGSVLLSLMIFTTENLFLTIGLVFVASIFIAISFPAVNGIYADLVSKKSSYEKEIESLSDFYTNLGYVIGPISAGFIADQFGNAGAFSVIGGVGVIVAIILIKISPKNIKLNS